MKLIIGLGNIGKEYEQTRHNVGFMCLGRFAAKHKLIFKAAPKYYYTTYRDCLLIMPRTYMNNSGEAYQSVLKKYSAFADVLVISDDIELPTGKIRPRISGGDGGHNGLKSILAYAGEVDVRRIRIGIGRDDDQTARDYVLDEFTDTELDRINQVLDIVAGWLELYIRFDIKRLLDDYSKWMKNPIPSETGGINRPKEEKE